MIINLARLLDKKSTALEINREMANFVEEINVKGSILVDGLISVDNEELTIDLDVKLNICQECSRCLEEFVFPLEVKVFEKYDRAESHEILQSDTLDLSELIRENILLNIPMKSVCKEDCKGLCAQCGINKNTDSCDCKADDIDPRLNVLKNLLDGAE